MRVLVACEMSGVVRDAFLERGHDAWSCDLVECNIRPSRHILGDVRPILGDGWDLLIAHPPCTALCVTGNRHYAGTKEREDAIDFFRLFLEAPVGKIAVENPVSKWFYETSLLPKKDRAQARSITFSGIAQAMADQWG